MEHEKWMRQAFEEARAGIEEGQTPFGAIVVRGGAVVARGHNEVWATTDPTAHAEVVAIRRAALALGTIDLGGCVMYTTCEPCPMCAAAISFARIRRLYFGAQDPKGGAVVSGVRLYDQPTCHHAPEVYPGFAEQDSAALLRDFFRARR